MQRITLGNLQLLAGQFLVETGHAVGVPATEAGLQRQVAPGRAGVEGVPKRRGFFGSTGGDEVGFRRDDDQGRRMLRPIAVEFIQQAQEALPVRRVTARIQKPPRLRVVGRRRPACCFEETQQRLLRDALAGKGAGRPALGELGVDRIIGNTGVIAHGQTLMKKTGFKTTAPTQA